MRTAWNSCIADSPQLQVATFMVPLDRTEKATDSRPNPLLLKILPAFFGSTHRTGQTVDEIIDQLPWSEDKQWSEAIARPTASWRKKFKECPPKRHNFKFGDMHRRMSSGRNLANMDVVFSTVVRRFFRLVDGGTYDELFIGNSKDVRTYKVYDCHDSHEIKESEVFERVHRAWLFERPFPLLGEGVKNNQQGKVLHTQTKES